jgi:hypothetical protein
MKKEALPLAQKPSTDENESEQKKSKTDSAETKAEKKDVVEEASPEAKTETPVHVWSKGDKIENVIRERYHIPKTTDWTDSWRLEAVIDLVLYHNGLKNKKRIPEGKNLVLPDRDQIFIQAGFPSEFREQLQNLFRVESLYHEYGLEATRYCDKRTGLPKDMKDTFEEMAEKVSELKTKLETKKTEPISKELKKVLDGLDGLYHTFIYILKYPSPDPDECEWEGKDNTATKRLFSNLSYRLYKWVQQDAARSSAEP